MAPRKPRSDDEDAWMDQHLGEAGYGSITTLWDKEPIGKPAVRNTFPMGFDISPVPSRADRIRKRKGRPK